MVITEVMMPVMDGNEMTAVVREEPSPRHTPVFMLTARTDVSQKIEGLAHGADDYLTKPFGTAELLARIRVALRHSLKSMGADDGQFEVGELRVDLVRRQVFVQGNEVHLSPIEYKLLTILVQYAGKVVTGRQLLKHVWGPGYEHESHYVRVYMGQLRHKLEADPARPRYLITEPGVGYRLKVE